ncbi:hypothetical protein EIN_462400 [Entamoeba invadens IP1]|uniref:EF-hand domain-containing protein n=1 Tax=Entamoeba invadens IP1 TaxID=370355 RepID=A0A0A1UC90_ENTIV|nr:hypothetical protein EIN_462400 [Entamoeba invadens IP1]ELP89884.1 hypothetical protein EIN_462400 [Entamoeba invadens IP1]|eukprot:XP_004256655.1 hypothetical protein EIN_462400 [Entamoeba invadens IP1]
MSSEVAKAEVFFYKVFGNGRSDVDGAEFISGLQQHYNIENKKYKQVFEYIFYFITGQRASEKTKVSKKKFVEFYNYLPVLEIPDVERILSLVLFKMIDKDGNGTVDEGEFAKFTALMQKAGIKEKHKEGDFAFSAIKTQTDKTITLEQFHQWFRTKSWASD